MLGVEKERELDGGAENSMGILVEEAEAVAGVEEARTTWVEAMAGRRRAEWEERSLILGELCVDC